ncbi:MAG TPA: lysyl oxidase family protein [Clostridia bacterium]|nr:lysyl oxidase family protein [Clostridia bacterium]
MTVSVRGRSLSRIIVALGVASVLASIAPAVPVEAATDRLPDLRAASIRDMRITTSGGRRLLRFTSIMWNQGAGPFEIRANRSSTRTNRWDVDQIVYDDAGGHRRVETNASLRHAGDGHDHWHVRRVMAYHLWSTRGTLRDVKIGFCFFDTNRIDSSLPRSPSLPAYRESGCGGPSTTSTRTGISVGWGDKYPWNFAYQWIDITGLPGGTYTIRTAVDPHRWFEEERDGNNCSWARIRFGSSGSTVTVLERGATCIDDHSTTAYAAAIAWALETGVGRLCDADLYCTYNGLTRGLLASMLARAMGLPSTDQDFYSDDEGSAYEADINRLAAAGIASPCGSGRFCPDKVASRGSAAAFLVRALALGPVDGDFYADDNGTIHETYINRLHAAGIATGCGSGKYCPSNPETRGHWSLYLYRAFGTD